MSGLTTNEGIPYPGEGDFADVQDAYRLATAIDSDLRADQAPYRAFLARPSFIAMQNATQSGISVGSQILNLQTVEWDNTGGLGATSWTQPVSRPPSWWMFGTTLRVNPTGTPVAGDLNMGNINVVTADPVTGIQSISNFYQRNDESVTGGEWINMFTMVPIYRAFVRVFCTFNGSTAKGLLAGSRFWGFYLGPVS